ncbi:major royal jelly protein 1-like isoform X1 [Vanessa atalanta]|uniref:major royal jelly protein 1-like isoform X1 n=2 Tax=Vanessa atalanta TaxID=42275 RepID=UPI001FCD7737|nr:major royal jelly protein 1-like isoform X1 [Vanessa atalanta]XP_047529879.1 major royal jelly protein 1-like isoform X1 [Vanessa atalanta]
MTSSHQNRVCRSLLSQYDPYILDIYKSEMGYGVDRFFLLSYCLACCWSGLGAKSNLRIVKQWSELKFVFPSEEAQQAALANRFYVPGNSVPIDVDVHHRKGPAKSRIFVTIPRFDEGRPVTLGTVDEEGLVSGYPDYSWHDNQGNNCDGLTSVFRIAIDKCDRLWVMDSGKIGEKAVCPPQLLAFDLKTDQLVYKHRPNPSSYIATSLFITPVVDVRGHDCSDTFVYVADVSGFGLLVVDVINDRSWRVTHRLMYPYPSHGTFTIDGESFDLMDGVLGMALSPYKPGLDRYLYFHALASTSENVVRTSVLRNDSFIADSNANPYSVNVFPQERPNQSAAEAMDSNGILYFGLMEPPGIWCWNSGTEFSTNNFHQIAINKETLQFSSGVKVVKNLKGEEELWLLTSSFQRVMTGSISSDRINFRIHAEKIPLLLENSACRQPAKGDYIGKHADRISPQIKKYMFKYGAVAFL